MREKERKIYTLSGLDQQTKLNFPILRTFFRKAKGSCYYLHKISASTATQENKRISMAAKTRQTRSPSGKQFGHLQAHVLPFILMQRGNLRRGLSLVARWHPSLLLIENKSFACLCSPPSKQKFGASSSGYPLSTKASVRRDAHLCLAEGLEIKYPKVALQLLLRKR